MNTRKIIVLLRHGESEKNIKTKLSSSMSKERLTQKGVNQATQYADLIKVFLERNNLNVKNIYCADSSRGIETASIIADILQAQVLSYSSLKSFSVGNYAGMSESALKRIDPLFINNLKLYRKGLVNSYDIIYEGSKETLQQYEKCVIDTVEGIVTNDERENCKIIVMHRSALTATLLSFARRFYNYPPNFYGYVQINLGTLSVIDYSIDEAKFLEVCSNVTVLKNLKLT